MIRSQMTLPHEQEKNFCFFFLKKAVLFLLLGLFFSFQAQGMEKEEEVKPAKKRSFFSRLMRPSNSSKKTVEPEKPERKEDLVSPIAAPLNEFSALEVRPFNYCNTNFFDYVSPIVKKYFLSQEVHNIGNRNFEPVSIETHLQRLKAKATILRSGCSNYLLLFEGVEEKKESAVVFFTSDAKTIFRQAESKQFGIEEISSGDSLASTPVKVFLRTVLKMNSSQLSKLFEELFCLKLYSSFKVFRENLGTKKSSWIHFEFQPIDTSSSPVYISSGPGEPYLEAQRDETSRDPRVDTLMPDIKRLITLFQQWSANELPSESFVAETPGKKIFRRSAIPAQAASCSDFLPRDDDDHFNDEFSSPPKLGTPRRLPSVSLFLTQKPES